MNQLLDLGTAKEKNLITEDEFNDMKAHVLQSARVNIGEGQPGGPRNQSPGPDRGVVMKPKVSRRVRAPVPWGIDPSHLGCRRLYRKKLICPVGIREALGPTR